MLRLVLVVARKIVALVGWVQIPYLNPYALVNGIGRHVGLRNRCSTACEFESHQGHLIFPLRIMDSILVYEAKDKSSTLLEEA